MLIASEGTGWRKVTDVKLVLEFFEEKITSKLYFALSISLSRATKNLAAELGRYGIRVNYVSPMGVVSRSNFGVPIEKVEASSHTTAALKGMILRVEGCGDGCALLGDFALHDADEEQSELNLWNPRKKSQSFRTSGFVGTKTQGLEVKTRYPETITGEPEQWSSSTYTTLTDGSQNDAQNPLYILYISIPSPFPTQNLKPQFRQIPPLQTHTNPLQICRVTNPSRVTELPDPVPTIHAEHVGLGAAAPTRGDIFLEHQKSLAAAATAGKKKKKKREKTSGSSQVANSSASCYGCGAPLQISVSDAPGYVDPDTYELKKKHRQLRTVICGRCRLLSHGHMITAVGGNGGYSGGKQFVTAEELREKLSHLRHERALIVKLVDIVDFNGSFLAHVRDLAGANPIILVVTKVDLLPRGTDFNCLGDWVVEATLKKKLNVLSVHLTSSKSLVGIAGVVSDIQKEKKVYFFSFSGCGHDVYILGSANVGKSAFINALLKMLSYKDPVAAAARKYKPIQSAVPGTTVGPIQINAFTGGKLFDTPGVHLHHRQAAMVHSEDLPAIAPRSRLRGQSVRVYFLAGRNQISQVDFDNLVADKFESEGLNGHSIFWGGLVRIDILKVLPETCVTFFGPKALKIHIVPTKVADEFYKKEVGLLLTPPTGKEKADDWSGLETERTLQIKYEDAERQELLKLPSQLVLILDFDSAIYVRPACDVAISGLGWITVEPVSKSLKRPDSNPEETATELLLAVHVPKPVEVFVRPPMPVGKSGGEWYQYRELTEKEEEGRPKWYF
ncbi:hypothetical protein RJ639_021138 [Escallonia herrerae]|uniref:G domain-containing protein n=1 Tax=Escallonia herrerae TaxID=1293975 RepID=A0AA88V534_9ASTE|nr:hypothetical protein RJ639_021138 [Escallonia herrerae]